MLYLQVFLVGLVFSFLGSIPPGTLNLCVLQLGLEKKISVALRFALAVSIVEYPYAWIGVEFEYWITSSPWVVRNFQLITALVMTAMGVLNIWSARNPTSFSVKFNASGFRRGIVLSILNPMAIPFWIGITAYLKSQRWIDLSTTGLLHTYVLGTSIGAMALLTLYTFLANRLSVYIQNSRVVQLVPGITLLLLGMYAFGKFFSS
jgi:threonine/homoserine/homoserine lactone efflux protein